MKEIIREGKRIQRKIDPSLESMFSTEGFVRVGDTDAGVKFVRGSDFLLVSGHYVFLGHQGMIRAFPEDKVPMLGIGMMEKLTRLRVQPHSGREDMTNYYLPMAKDNMI